MCPLASEESELKKLVTVSDGDGCTSTFGTKSDLMGVSIQQLQKESFSHRALLSVSLLVEKRNTFEKHR